MSADNNLPHAAGSALEQFRARVIGDGALQDALLQPNDPETFITRVLEEAVAAALVSPREDVTAAMHAAQHAWRMRRIFG